MNGESILINYVSSISHISLQYAVTILATRTVRHRSYSICNALEMHFQTNEIGSVRSDPQINFTGLLNVTIMEIKLVLHYRRNMLMCTQW